MIYKGSDNYYLEAMSTNSSLPAGGGTFGSTTVETYGTAALAGEHMDALSGDVRWGDDTAVRERDAGIESGADGEPSDVDATHWRLAGIVSGDSISQE